MKQCPAESRSGNESRGNSLHLECESWRGSCTTPGIGDFLDAFGDHVDALEELALPTMLPPYYEKLKEENGIIEDKPPVSAPCFENWKDPDGRLRQLAGIVCQ